MVTAVAIILATGPVAPVFGKSLAMLRSVIGTGLPFALIFLAGSAAALARA